MSRPVDIDGRTEKVGIGVSFGVALYPQDGITLEDLLSSVGLALKRAKAISGSSYRFFDQSLVEAERRSKMLKDGLHGALERQELQLVYQPRVTIATGKVTSFEVLLRWQHPLLGPLNVEEFILEAEKAGLAASINTWTLEQACSEAGRWPTDISVGVHLSSTQLRDQNQLRVLADAIERVGLAAGRLRLGVREEVFTEDVDSLAILQGAKALGFRFVLDNFGAGYLSLSYLQRFPFDTLKIDRSFTALVTEDESVGAVVRATVSLARSLGSDVTADGVETVAQLDFLREAGCDHAQGKYFSPPIPPSEVPELLKRLSF